jgi:hypothetical protein
MKKITKLFMLLAVSSLAFVSCEDDFDYYSNTNGNTNGNGQGTGGNGGTGGTGGSSCYLTKVFTDGSLSEERFYNADYSQVTSIKQYSTFGEVTLTYHWNSGTNLLDSSWAMSNQGGFEIATTNYYSYDSQNRLIQVINNGDLSSSEKDITWGVAGQGCGATETFTTTTSLLGEILTQKEVYEYLDSECSQKVTVYNNDNEIIAENTALLDGPLITVTTQYPDGLLLLDNVTSGKMPYSTTNITYTGGVTVENNASIVYDVDSDGKILSMTVTNIPSMGAQTVQTLNYEYHCE